MMMVIVLVVYGPLLTNEADEAETELPKLILPTASLHPKLFDVLLVQIVVWVLLWLVDEAPFEVVVANVSPDDVDCATLPLLKFILNWLHEPVFDVQELHCCIIPIWVLLSLIEHVDVALVLWAKTAFDVVVKSKNTAVIIIAIMINNFVLILSSRTVTQYTYIYLIHIFDEIIIISK
jgi:hypothetical protein